MNKISVYNLCGFRISTKKAQSFQNNPKNFYTEKKVTNLQDTHGVQYARLMRQKTDAIFIGEKIVLKRFVEI